MISHYLLSAALLTTNPFFDPIIWQLGFVNQTQLPAWLSISVVHHLDSTIYRGQCLAALSTLWKLSIYSIYIVFWLTRPAKVWGPVGQPSRGLAAFVICLSVFFFSTCNMHGVNFVTAVTELHSWMVCGRDERAAFRQRGLQGLSRRVDRLEMGTLTLQTSQSLACLFSSIFHFNGSNLTRSKLWLAKMKVWEGCWQGAPIRKRKKVDVWQQLLLSF